MTMRIILSALLAALPALSFAQSDGPIAKPSIAVYGTPLVYNNPDLDTAALVEFPFALNRSDFEFFRPDSADPAFYARIFAQVVLMNAAANAVDSTNTYFSVRAASMTEARASTSMIFNKLLLVVRPGVYTAKLTVIDVVNKHSEDLVLGPFSVAPPQRDHLELAGPCLAYRISYVSDSSPAANDRMVKNQHLVLPNPAGVCGIADSVAFVYAELYNLSPISTDSSFEVAFLALDERGNLYRDFGVRTSRKPGTSAVLAEALDIRGWPVGKYSLRIIAADPASGQQDTATLPIRIVDPEYVKMALSGRLSRDPYDSLSNMDRINLVAYLLTPNEKASLNRLSDSGKQNFLSQYWKDYDNRPKNSGADPRSEYVRRYRYSQANFSTDEYNTNGWSTDRGRIYMTYGTYDQKDEVQAPRKGNPFVIWYYRGVREGKLFVFEDVEGYHDFKLVHSNVPGERSSDEWAQRLKDEMLDIY
ncbi:MAG: GWxTD domain-containing protein [Candidatus Zixiibacteriota bacterium]